jgi:NodT family efflux transporter outer membrane factor (OMF) lipoprotein
MGPDYQQPETNAPSNWLAAEQAENRQAISAESLKVWWKSFGDNQLNSLIEQALNDNFDLQIGLSRINQSRAVQAASHAELFPSISMDAGPQRNVNPFPGFAPGLRYNLFQTGFDAAWEIDAFGRLQRQAEAAKADSDAAKEQYAQALLTLTADLARNYIEFRSLQNQLEIFQTSQKTLRQSLELTEKLYNQGMNTRADIHKLRSEIESAAANITNLEAAISVKLRQLEVLLGQKPGNLTSSLSLTKAIPAASEVALFMSPAETLRRRPDIRIAERQLASATAKQGSAMAEMFPKISISAFLGLRNTDLENLIKSSSFAYSTGANLLQPLLNFGRIQAGIDMADAQQKQAYLNYEKTIVNALQETEMVLIRYLKQQISQQNLNRSVTELQESNHLTELRYQEGVTTFMEVLEAQRTLYSAQIRLAQSEAETATDLIAVFKALGGSGGFDNIAAAS